MLQNIVYQLFFRHLSVVQPLVEQLHEMRHSYINVLFPPQQKKN